MYGSPPVSKDLNHPFPPPPPSSDHHLRRHQQHQMSSGLLRYRSAPSTLLGDLCEDFLPVRPSSPETETMFARFLGSDLRPDKPAAAMKDVAVAVAAAGGGGFSAPQMLYRPPQQQQQQQMPSHNPVDAAYRVAATSMGLETEQMKGGGGSGGNSSNLIRHSSSPAGLFAQLNVENGYGMMRGMGGSSSSGGGGYRNGNGAMGEVASPSSAAAVAASRLKGQISFSSRQNSASSGLMSQISEELEGIGPDEGGANCRYMPTGFPTGSSSWDDSALLSDGFSGLKRGRSVDAKLVTGLNQSEPPRNGIGSTDMAALEKFLQFQDSVPCKIRAKRGCATHPRSIAERVRRTRISERMRKLQELVPNMDKQTNTADMLDLAVEHIKDLQREVKNLSDSRASCTCSSSKHKPYSKSGV